ncbi:GIY-YIG nuclease family protein [Shewanella mangrovisoli]|uniref:GIY-YIG nuclease family protein n=1 Tax=Shewanella mangrovisoli TaxID=2864211 RepID=UPI0035BA2742
MNKMLALIDDKDRIMKNGYVYILTNASMPDLIKIGKTARDSRERAKELSKTSVPTPFKVAFELFSFDYDVLEKNIHSELSDFRVNPNREFFRYPLDKAIALLQKLNSTQDREDAFEAVDITDLLLQKYPVHLKDEIVSVRIVQPKERVWLEITTEKTSQDGFMLDQTIKREDLAFITDASHEDGLFFKREDHVQVNARKFVNEFDPYSIIMTTDLFKEEYCYKIDKEYRASKGRS